MSRDLGLLGLVNFLLHVITAAAQNAGFSPFSRQYFPPSIEAESQPQRSGRLLTNPLGIFGHTPCFSYHNLFNLTGHCFNELECLGAGGNIHTYCSPSALGGCCIFSYNRCGQVTSQKASYFTNPDYPNRNQEPKNCDLHIRPKSNVCFIQVDFLDVSIGNVNGKCAYDAISIIGSKSGPSGRFCGEKKKYATLVEVSNGEQITLSVLTQSPNYKWNIKVTMIDCTDVPESVVREPECGISGISEGAQSFSFARTNTGEDIGDLKAPSEVRPSTILKRKVKKRLSPAQKQIRDQKRTKSRNRKDSIVQDDYILTKKERGRHSRQLDSTNDEDSVCSQHTNSICKYIEEAQLRNNNSSRTTRTVIHVDRYDVPRPAVAYSYRRKLSSQLFRPSLSVGSTFCQSKFRQMKPKIFDGFEAPVGAFPWIVSLQHGGTHFCGGSVIAARWILTAAHCPDFPNVPDFLSNLTVLLGDHNINSDSETVSLEMKVDKIIFYPIYDQDSYDGDVALLKLEKPVVFSRNIRPACLPLGEGDSYEKQVGVAAGWGVTEAGEEPDALRFVELNIVPNVTCVANLGVADITISERMICTFKGPTGYETTCTGDSGGPLMVKRSGRYYLVGVTSFSLVDCESPFPNVFARTSSFLRWISVAMRDFGEV